MRYKLSFGGSLSPVVKVIIIINISVYLLLSLAKNSSVILPFVGLVPATVIGERYFWQLITYMFVHVDFWHVLFNMLALWWFACDIERNFGQKYFLRYYFFTGIGAGIFAVLLAIASPIPIIGASGAVFGILLAYAILFPNRTIYLWFVIPVKAKWLVLAFAMVEVFAVMKAAGSGVSHAAHVGGLMFGLLWFGYYLKIYKLGWVKGMFMRKKKPSVRIVKIDDKNIIEIDRDDRDGTVH